MSVVEVSCSHTLLLSLSDCLLSLVHIQLESVCHGDVFLVGSFQPVFLKLMKLTPFRLLKLDVKFLLEVCYLPCTH